MYFGSPKGQISTKKHTPRNQNQKTQTNKMKENPSPSASHRWQGCHYIKMCSFYKLQAPQTMKAIKSQQHNIYAVLQL